MSASRTCRHTGLVRGLLLWLAASMATACGGSTIVDEAKARGKTTADFRVDTRDYFQQMDMVVEPAGAPGSGPRLASLSLTPEEAAGRNTWMMWCGGNERFWDWLARNGYGFLDLLKLAAFNPENRWPRFRDAGLVVEPGTVLPGGPDEYGLWIRQPADPSAPRPDEAVYGRSSGIVGLRLFPNPHFDDRARRAWDAAKYFTDPEYYRSPSLVRPYRVGMTCAFCHVAPHPLNPPPNVEEPGWEHLSATIGNQYFHVQRTFGNLLTPDSLLYHVLESEPRGTIDTSLIPSDNINNPNTMNALWELPGRLDRSGIFVHRPDPGYGAAYTSRYGTNPVEEVDGPAAKMPVLLYSAPDAYANPRPTARILFDGSDSIGPWGALARVYLNIGTFSERWNTLHNPIFGFRHQRAFGIDDARANSVYWQATDAMVDGMAKYFLKSTRPMRLKDAPGGAALVKGEGVPWSPALAAGRRVFAQNCIACHSSKQPKTFDAWPAERLPELLRNEEYRAWAAAEVEKPDFWQDNYLSTDRRVPVTVVKTNSSRAMATNALAGQMWADFSSRTYKALPAVGDITVWNPVADADEQWPPRGAEEKWPAPGGGRGYYRPASLVSVWATAPLLHNNAVGIFTGDPSVTGRVDAFRDAIAKLLVRGRDEAEAASARWALGTDLNNASVERLVRDHGLIWRTPTETWLRIPAAYLPQFVAATTGITRTRLLWLLVLVPLALLALATLLVLRRRRILRRLGYVAMVVAIAVGLAAFFAAGRVTDLVIGPVPAGMPLSALTNVDPARLGEVPIGRTLGIMRALKSLPPGSEAAQRKRDELAAILLKVSKAPDLTMDRGHYFAAHLTADELRDLVDLLLTF